MTDIEKKHTCPRCGYPHCMEMETVMVDAIALLVEKECKETEK